MVTFKGYVRPDGQVGIRNHVVVIATACCAGGIVDHIAAQVPETVALRHTYGCSTPCECESWRKILIGVASNPNVYATILIGVGCETDNAYEMAKKIHEINGKPIFANIVQDDGGGQKVIENAVIYAKKAVEDAKKCQREEVPISKLVFATECGGSDALSGVTANPTIGYVADWVVKNGGTALLSETDELIGTEDILAARAVSKEVADKIYKIIYDEEEELRVLMGSNVSRTLAVGNMAGGLTTIQEKALGCCRKAGTSPIVDVIDYAEPVGDRKGLVLMNGPGYDPSSLTGLFCSGAQIAMYSTGRGTPLSHPGYPIIKVSSNTKTFEAVGGVNGDMDLNAGAIITDGISLEEMGERAIQYMLEALNGKETRPEKLGYGSTLAVYQSTRSW